MGTAAVPDFMNPVTMGNMRFTSIEPALVNAIMSTAKSSTEQEYFRNVLSQVDVGEFVHRQRQWLDAAIHVFEADDVECLMNSAESEWTDVEFEVALDSGSIVNVCHPDDVPGYALEESPGSRRGQHFVVGDGGKLKNMGQMALNLEAATGQGNINAVTSTFQIAKVTRPLMSVGHICDQGLKVVFDKGKAVVSDQDGVEICVFQRSDNGLYIAKMKLKQPASFGRQDK